jgi:cell volume regulation protein A
MPIGNVDLLAHRESTMHDIAPVVLFVGFLVFLAHFFVLAFERTRVPDVLYLIVIGLLIGPVFDIIRPEDFGKIGGVFTAIALVIILFEGGLDLGIDALKQSWRLTLSITVTSYVIAFICIFLALFLLPLDLGLKLFISAVLAGPAPSVIIPLVHQLHLEEKAKTTLMLESPLGESFGIIIALAILESYRLGNMQVGKLIGSLLSSFAFAFIIGTAGGFVWSILLNRMRQLRNSIFTTPSFLFVLYGIAEFLGFSGPITALMFGVTLGNIQSVNIKMVKKRFHLTPMVHTETERLFFGEIVFLLKTFFFVYLGISIRMTDYHLIGVSLAVVMALLASRLVTIQYLHRHGTPTDSLLMSVIIPRGTAAAVLAGIPLQMGIAGGSVVQETINSAIILSIIITSLLVLLIERAILPGKENPENV